MSDSEPKIRLKFFGLGDYGTFFQIEQAFSLIAEFDFDSSNLTVNDIVEIHQAALFVQHGLLPKAATEAEKDECQARLPLARRTVGVFFRRITEANVADVITDIDFQYQAAVLELLGKNKAFERCTATVLLPALRAAKIGCGELLANRTLVSAYDEDLRALILSEPRNAELLVAKHLQSDESREIHLPKSFTPSDGRALLDAYLDQPEPNLNFTQLIASARTNKATGIDARLKLKAQRKNATLTTKFFESNEGIQTGCAVSISETQTEAVVETLNGMVGKYSYSRTWLQENLDYPTILNNFIHLFRFASQSMVMELPSYHAELGVIARFLMTTGKESYKTGAAFNLKNQASLLQTQMYDWFLRNENIELEAVISWFFAEYLEDEFGAGGFKFRPSSSTATYLEKSRHLFSEMESVLKQFSLYVENGEFDPELLAMTSEQLVYGDIPSLLKGKYAYITDDLDIQRIQHLIFSDQSGLTYIGDGVQGDNFARLIIANTVQYDDFHDYQKRDVDFLTDKGIVGRTNGRINFASAHLFLALKELWEYDAISYYHQPKARRDATDTMTSAGWLARKSSLLTAAEVSYLNYWLNDKEFSDGPALRNRYLHGSQADGEDDRLHFQTYLVALRLLVLLVIKINDDFCMNSDAGSSER